MLDDFDGPAPFGRVVRLRRTLSSSEVSPGGLLEDGVIDREIGNDLAELGILGLQLLQPLGLIDA